MDLKERVERIDETISALITTVEYINWQILALLQEKNDCIHDMKVEAKRKKIGFKSTNENESNK